MKRIILIMLFIAAAGGAMSQAGDYHQVGDTVRGRCPIYYYENNWWPTLNAINHTDSMIGTATYVHGYMKHFTNTPLKVIGIASTWARMDKSNPSNVHEDIDTSIEGPLYYVLFDATANGKVEKARVCWTDDYMTHPKRYMELPMMGGTNSCETMHDNTAVVPLREYYFDSAITVTDSFYLGCFVPDIVASGPNAFNVFSYFASHMWNYCTYSVSEVDGPTSKCRAKVPEFTYYDSSRLDGTWYHRTRKAFQLIFPIIKVDTCVTPGVPYVASRDSLSLRVEWNDNGNLRWEVSRTVPGGDPEAGLITQTTSPYIEYTDIDDLSTYHVYVRGYCETGNWGGWSGWSTPCFIDSVPTPPNPPVGITPPDTAEITLSPNPADGTVELLGLQNGTAAVEILDMMGRVVKPLGTTTSFNISSLPAGIYIVRIKTKHDTAEKVTHLKLVKK